MVRKSDEDLARLGYMSITREHHTIKAELAGSVIRGAPVVLRLTASPLYDEKGQHAGAIESILDITAIKLAEEETLESTEKYRLLLENTRDPVLVHGIAGDRPGPFIDVNDPACRMLGYTRAEFRNLTLMDILPEQEQRLPGIIRELLSKRQLVFATDLVAKDGSRRPAEIHAVLSDRSGRPVVLSILRNHPPGMCTKPAGRPV